MFTETVGRDFGILIRYYNCCKYLFLFIYFLYVHIMSLTCSGQNKIILIIAETLVLLTSITNLKYKLCDEPK